jgi:hypothetical protein
MASRWTEEVEHPYFPIFICIAGILSDAQRAERSKPSPALDLSQSLVAEGAAQG